MRVAELLSDLTSLRACDSSAALALVSARPSTSTQITTNPLSRPSTDTNQTSQDKDPTILAATAAAGTETDADLQRARDLIELHAGVKMARRGDWHRGDEELLRLRTEVRGVLEGL